MIHCSDEGDDENERELLGGLKCESCRNCRNSADQQKIAQVFAGSDKSDRERDGGCSKKGCACDNSNLKRAEAQLGQVCRQDDDRESIAEATRSARGVQQEDVRWSSHSDLSIELIRLLFSQLAKDTV